MEKKRGGNEKEFIERRKGKVRKWSFRVWEKE